MKAKIFKFIVAILSIVGGIYANAQPSSTPPATAVTVIAEPGNFTFAGVKLGMTASEAMAAFNTQGLPAFSGYSTPVRTKRTGDDQSGDFEADYGPASGVDKFGQPIIVISARISWSYGRVLSIDVHNTSLSYDQTVAIFVSALGKPEITSDDNPDPHFVVARYAQWSIPANTATDVIKVLLSRPTPSQVSRGYVALPRIAIERENTKRYQFEKKTILNWSSNLQAAASDPNPSQAYWNLCASQNNVGNTTRAAIACDKLIAIDPTRADAYYMKGSILFAWSDEHFLPGTAEALKKYLELAPTGPHAAEVKEMLDMVLK